MLAEIRTTGGEQLVQGEFPDDTHPLKAFRILYQQLYPRGGGWEIGLATHFRGGGTWHVQFAKPNRRGGARSLEPTVVCHADGTE